MAMHYAMESRAQTFGLIRSFVLYDEYPLVIRKTA